MKKVRSESITLGNFLNQYFIKVPSFQRPYSWRSANIDEFWEDLVDGEASKAFLGTIILNTVPVEESAKKSNRCEIIDGQQRVLTTTIFLSALRDVMRGSMPHDGITDEDVGWVIDFIRRKDPTLGPNACYWIVEPGDTTKAYFQEHIQCRDRDKMTIVSFWNTIQSGRKDLSEGKKASFLARETTEEALVRAAYESFYSRINQLMQSQKSPQQQGHVLKDIMHRLINREIVVISVDGEDDAYEIFETTNARGIELSVSDLIKNVIFRHLRQLDQSEQAKSDWAEMMEDVRAARIDLKKLVRYFWLSKYGMVTGKQLFRKMKDRFGDDSQKWSALLQDLKTVAEHYRLLECGERNEWTNLVGRKRADRIWDSLCGLRRMSYDVSCIALLSLMRNITVSKNKDIHPIFEAVEIATFACNAVCNMKVGENERYYSSWARDIEDMAQNAGGKKSITYGDLLNKIKKDLSPGQMLPTREQFIADFVELEYHRERVPFLRYFFSRLIASKSGDELLVNEPNVSIEHILPQNPEEWKLTKKEIKRYVNKIGNLCLLSKALNGSAQNSVLQNKIAEYKESKLWLVDLLIRRLEATAYKWGESEIEERSKWLAGLAWSTLVMRQNIKTEDLDGYPKSEQI